MAGFEDLIVWKKARLLTKEIYCLTRIFPSEELFGISTQIRRAAISVISNIAEGYSRTRKEWRKYIRIALGSASELKAQIIIAKDVGLAPNESFGQSEELLGHVLRILNKMSHNNT